MTDYNGVILEAAGGYLGTEEWPGAKHNPQVVGFFAASGNSGIKDDETPWCAAFVGAVLAQLGLPHTGKLNARSYAEWGDDVPMSKVRPGDVVVLTRGAPPSGHVGFVVNILGDKVIIRGGNQGNKVSDVAFPLARVLCYRRVSTSGSYKGRPTISRGEKGLIAGDLQVKLRDLGYPSGPVDAHFGSLTEQALMLFQSDNGLESDGVVGPKTWVALDNAPKREITITATVDTLRQKGSTTIEEADKVDVAASVVGVVAVGREVANAATDAQGLLGTIEQLFLQHWLALLIIGVGFIAIKLSSGKIKQSRLMDTLTGKHIGR